MDLVKSVVSFLTFQRFYRYLLKRILGGVFIPDFGIDQLDVQLYSGIVQLVNVAVNVERINATLENARVPVTILSGSVKKLRVAIPWKSILQEKCRVYISDLYLKIRVDAFGDVLDTPAHPQSTDSDFPPSSGLNSSNVVALTRLVRQVLMNVEAFVEMVVVDCVIGSEEVSLRVRLSDVTIRPESADTKSCSVGGIYVEQLPGRVATVRVPTLHCDIELSNPGEIFFRIATDLVLVSIPNRAALKQMFGLAQAVGRLGSSSPDGSGIFESATEGPKPSAGRVWYEEIYSVIEAEVIRAEREGDGNEEFLDPVELPVIGEIGGLEGEKKIQFSFTVQSIQLALFKDEPTLPALTGEVSSVRVVPGSLYASSHSIRLGPVLAVATAAELFVSAMDEAAESWATESIFESVSDETESMDSSLLADEDSVEAESSNGDDRETHFFEHGVVGLAPSSVGKVVKQAMNTGEEIVRNGEMEIRFAQPVKTATFLNPIIARLTPMAIANLLALVETDSFQNEPSGSKSSSSIGIELQEGFRISIFLGNGHSMEIATDTVCTCKDGVWQIGSIGVLLNSSSVEVVRIRDVSLRGEMTVPNPPPTSMTESNSSQEDPADVWTSITGTGLLQRLRRQPDAAHSKLTQKDREGEEKSEVVGEKTESGDGSAERVDRACRQRARSEVLVCIGTVAVVDSALEFLNLQLKIQSLIDQLSVLNPQTSPPITDSSAATFPSVGVSVLIGQVECRQVYLFDSLVRTVVLRSQPLTAVLVRDCRLQRGGECMVRCVGGVGGRPAGGVISHEEARSAGVPSRYYFDSSSEMDFPLNHPPPSPPTVDDCLTRFSSGSVARVSIEVSPLPENTSRISFGLEVRGLQIAFAPDLIDFYKSLTAFFNPPVVLVSGTAPLITAPPRPTFTVYSVRLEQCELDWQQLADIAIVSAASLVVDGAKLCFGVLSTVDSKTPAGVSFSVDSIELWLAKQPHAGREVDLGQRGYVRIMSVSDSEGLCKWKGKEVGSLDFTWGAVRADLKADSYAGVGNFAQAVEGVIGKIFFSDSPVANEQMQVSLPPLAQPVPGMHIRENFMQSKRGRGGSRFASSEIIKPQPAVAAETLGVRWLVNPKDVTVLHDHLMGGKKAGGKLGISRKKAEAQVRASGGALRMASISLSVRSVRIFLLNGFHWEGTEFHLAGLGAARRLRGENGGSPNLICIEMDNLAASFLSVYPNELLEASIVISDLRIRDGVQGSVFQHLLSAWHPPEVSPMGPASNGQVSFVFSKQGPDAKAEVMVQPICVTVDQDTLEFVSGFIKQTSLLGYRSEEVGGLAGVDRLEGRLDESPSRLVETEEELTISENLPDPSPSLTPPPTLLFQSFILSSISVEVNYRSKRLSMSGLRRGDPLQILNLLPMLEGLQVQLGELRMRDVSDCQDLTNRLKTSWAHDINRAQILRSLSGVKPIRSVTNLTTGIQDLVSQPLRQMRRKDGHLSRGILRGLSSFLRTLTVESLNLADVVVSTAQSALEYVDDLTSGGPEETLECEWDDSDEGSEVWTAVERGSRERQLDPASAIEGLRSGSDALIRGVRSGLTSQSSSRNGLIVSIARGAPSILLKPVIGATQAVSVVLRGARSSVDSGRQRAETERRFKGPYAQGDILSNIP